MYIVLAAVVCVFDAVRLWNIAGRRSVVRYVGHNYPVHCVDAWYDCQYLLSLLLKCLKIFLVLVLTRALAKCLLLLR